MTTTNTDRSKAASLSEAASSSRDLILAAAERLILENGYRKASIAEICRLSGFPVGSVYHFFGNKAGILVAVVESRTAVLFEQLEAAARVGDTPEERMATYFSSAPALLLANFQLMRGLYTDSVAEDSDVILGRERDLQQGTEYLVNAILPVARKRGCRNPTELAENLAHFAMTHTIGAVFASNGDLHRLSNDMCYLHDIVRGAIDRAA